MSLSRRTPDATTPTLCSLPLRGRDEVQRCAIRRLQRGGPGGVLAERRGWWESNHESRFTNHDSRITAFLNRQGRQARQEKPERELAKTGALSRPFFICIHAIVAGLEFLYHIGRELTGWLEGCQAHAHNADLQTGFWTNY